METKIDEILQIVSNVIHKNQTILKWLAVVVVILLLSNGLWFFQNNRIVKKIEAAEQNLLTAKNALDIARDSIVGAQKSISSVLASMEEEKTKLEYIKNQFEQVRNKMDYYESTNAANRAKIEDQIKKLKMRAKELETALGL